KKIKEMVECSNHARDIGVVSDDRQIRHYAGALGAKKVLVEDFLRMINSSPTEQTQTFKLDQRQADQINRELAEIWLNK
ncbi:MAG: hypothetical protein JW714_01285, partial [Candidatus Omnitrophica bacterium]|nr:hypothetical protein [Candidatus Omnitrophota bacterium]